MSDKERFDLYKHYECMKSRLIRFASGCKYKKDSLEDMFATKINEEINSFAYIKDKSMMDTTFNYLIKSIKSRFKSYMQEVFQINNVDFLYNFNYDCSFDSFVKQVNDALFVYEKRCGAIEDILNRIKKIVKEDEISAWVADYIDKIVLQANNFNSLSEYYENQKCIDSMLDTLKEKFDKYNTYNNKAKMLEELFGDFAPKSLINFLENFKKAVWEGRFASADSILMSMNTLVYQFKVKKSEVNYTLKVMTNNYNEALKELKNEEDVENANRMYNFLMKILQNVLKGVEERDILNSLQKITFRSMDEIYELASYKTKSLYVDIDANKKIVGSKLITKINSDDKYFYCFSYPSLEIVKLARRNFNKKYVGVYSLYGKKNKFGNDFINVLNEMGISVSEEVSITKTINEIVEFIDEQRVSIDKSNEDNISLKRNK